MFGRNNFLTKVFLCVQLTMACIFIISAVMFTQNTMYLSERPWGYNNKETLYANIPDQSAFEKLRDVMIADPNVASISGAAHHVGKSHQTVIAHFPERDYEVDRLAVDANYFQTMDIHVKEGRVFNDHEGSDKQAVVVNEFLVKNMMWDHPIGETFRIDSIEYSVVGVVADFHSYSFTNRVRPIIFTVAAAEDYRYLALKARPGTEIKTYLALQERWTKLFPEIPFTGGFQEDVWGPYYEQIAIYNLVWRVFASLVIVLALLGLYGLVKLNVEGRTKEFSIRKVLGAGLKNIAANILSQYTILFTLAILAGGSVGYFAGVWLITASYPYHMPITYSGAVIGVVTMMVVLLGTISTQVKKVMKANPVNGLNME